MIPLGDWCKACAHGSKIGQFGLTANEIRASKQDVLDAISAAGAEALVREIPLKDTRCTKWHPTCTEAQD